ncbi:MAG TPA: BACON domain-containing protein [Paludibacteraceae bacterium]|jgi:hypothetical protein|nr:BACON domain-containing protein [Prolixibacteraceae bacterium]HPS10656.1 BACON domain-containing protein [Paludibacteraceae bacterium]
MKIKYLFPIFFAALAFMTSCNEEETMTLLDEIQVSSSYVAIPDSTGGSKTVTITSKQDWAVDTAALSKSKVKWLTISKISGNAGESEITFTAPSTLNGRSAEVLIKSGGVTQRINIIQGLPKISTATCAQVIAGPDSKTYQVTGVCTSIANTVYGNWYLKDATGTIYIYGTLDAKGATQKFSSLGIEVGDEVTVQGPKTTYGSVIELVNVTVVKINKSLIKVDSVKNAALPLEGGEITTYLTCKGQGVSVVIPDDAKSWLSISSIQSAGTKTVMKFIATSNTGGDRGTTLTFRTTDGTKDYTSQTALSQKGAIVTATVADFIAAANKTTQYRLKGVITSIADASKGRFYLKDFSGEVYVYNMSGFQSLGLKAGDIVTLLGKYDVYNGTHELVSATLESKISVTPTTIADVLTKPDDTATYYMITGEITSVANPTYGNLYLKDGASEIYVYGCYPGYGATGEFRKNLLSSKGIKVGDRLTVIGTKTTYQGTVQLANGIYFSHVSVP